MTSRQSFQAFVEEIARAQSQAKLISCFMDQASNLFAANHLGFHLLDENLQFTTAAYKGIDDSLVDRVRAIAQQDHDPVLAFLAEHHTPIHEGLLFTSENWKTSTLYQNVCSYYNHEHIMMGPIVGQGKLTGTVLLARTGDTSAFGSSDLAQLWTLCTHLSTCLALLQQQRQASFTAWHERLTARELQIADLVAQGLTSKEIGGQLWITHNSVRQALKRMFQKLEVSNRAELVAKLGGFSVTGTDLT